METVEFFSKLARRLGHDHIKERSGVSRPTIAKLLSFTKSDVKKPQVTSARVLDAVEELAMERVNVLRKEADEIVAHIPGLRQWKEELQQG